MVVTDKTREIGILKAMGMPARSIRRIFFAQGVVIGVVGTALGVASALGAIALGRYKFIALDPQVYFIDHMPVSNAARATWCSPCSRVWRSPRSATLYPSVQAARLFPIDAIRHE